MTSEPEAAIPESDHDNDCAVFMNPETFGDEGVLLALPEGVISFLPGTLYDENEGYGIIDFKVALGPDVVKGVLTAGQAKSLRWSLDWAIEHAKDSEPGNPTSEAMRKVRLRKEAEAEAESKIDWSVDAPEPKPEGPLQQLFEYQAGGYPVGRAIIVSSGGERPDPCVIGFIADLELDVFRVVFDGDGGAELETDGMTHVSLSEETMYQLIDMGEGAQELFAKLAELPTDQHGDVTGWEHLITHPRQIEEPPTEVEAEAPTETGREA